MENQVLENPVFDLEKIEVGQLPELQGLKEKQLQIVAENPFVQIVDNKTFEEAKKSRTTLVSARTEIQNQDKLIASKIKKFRESVSGISAELIAITQPHEEKQQSEVKRYEAEKEAEKLEKQRIEDERKAGIKAEIEDIYKTESIRIQNITFADIESCKSNLENVANAHDLSKFEEFELDFAERLMMLKNQLSAKEIQLNEIEAQRIENERLKAEREKLEAERKEMEEKQRLENERIAKEQKDAEEKLEADRKVIEDQQKEIQNKLDADRKELEAKAKIEADKLEADRLKIQNEQKDAQAKLNAERAKLDAEKAEIAKAEADKEAERFAEVAALEKADNDRKNAEQKILDDKAEADRLEALKPEKLKACDFLNSLKFNTELPVVTDTEILILIENFIDETDQKRNDLIMFISNL